MEFIRGVWVKGETRQLPECLLGPLTMGTKLGCPDLALLFRMCDTLLSGGFCLLSQTNLYVLYHTHFLEGSVIFILQVISSIHSRQEPPFPIQ